ncbi:MAG: type II secretion system F family protein, partial [Verrucomicrobia bacterium]|nr:type II secretion system F family protein [Verrucomicrobiota bacterium]
MPTFHYTARDASGTVTTGTLDSPSRRDALRRLQTRGLKPPRLDEASGTDTASSRSRQRASAAPRSPLPAPRSALPAPTSTRPPGPTERL